MAESATDRDLLFGLIALQNGLIDQTTLVASLQSTAADRSRSLGEQLRTQGVLSPELLRAVEAMTVAQLRRHDDDATRGLASLGASTATRQLLGQIDDPGLRSALTNLATPQETIDLTDRGRDAAIGAVTAGAQRFRVLRPHARGGIGEVLVAIDGELNREVALKRIQGRLEGDPASRARFLLEAEITGGLEHPGIVPVYSLGTAEDGRPYYAMRFIKGESLKESIERFHPDRPDDAPGAAGPGPPPQPDASPTEPRASRDLELRRLLRHFLDVCNAVDYAHSRGVLHRDLKPGNIIVGRHGETLVVDWGLAKVTGVAEPGGGETSLRPASASGSSETLPGSALGTPAFMSPEQASGDLDHLGPPSDVYGLGATLYALLTGRPPVEGTGVIEALERVRRGEFPPPRQVQPSVAPALEAICLKAMALRPQDRYPNARTLAEDIERWLADEPVSARVEPLAERARRWARRHRTLVTSAGAVLSATLVGLLVFTIVLGSKNRDLAAARSRAEAREREAIAAVRRFGDVVSGNPELKNNPALAPLRKSLLGEPIDFFRRLRRQLQAERDTGADSVGRLAGALLSLGDLTDEIGDKQDAIAGYREALALLAPLGDRADREQRTDLGRLHLRLGSLLARTGRQADALTEFDRALAIRGRLARESGDLRSRSMLAEAHNSRANLLADLGRLPQAHEVYEQAVRIQEDLVTAQPSNAEWRGDLAGTLNNLAILLKSRGDWAAAEAVYRRALVIRRGLLEAEPGNPVLRSRLATLLINLAHLESDANRQEPAERAYREALRIRSELVAEFPTSTEHRADLASSHAALGAQLRATGRYEEGLEHYRENLAIRQALAREHPTVTDFQNSLAGSHMRMGHILSGTGHGAEALREYERACDIRRQLVEANPGAVSYQNLHADSLNALGCLQGDLGALEIATESLERALGLRERLVAQNPEVPGYRDDLAVVLGNLGRHAIDCGRNAEALSCYRRAVAIHEELRRQHPAVNSYASDLGSDLNNLGSLLDDQGQFEAARAAYERAVALRSQLARENPTVVLYRRDLAAASSNLGVALDHGGRAAEAEAAYRAALGIRQELATQYLDQVELRRGLGDSHHNLAGLLQRQNQLGPAEESYRQALAIRQRLVDQEPSKPAYRRDLAATLDRLASLLDSTGRWDEARSLLDGNLRALERLARESPDSPGSGLELVTARIGLADRLMAHGRNDEAAEAIASARPVRSGVADSGPEAEAILKAIGAAHHRLGNAWAGSGRLDEAEAELGQAREVRASLMRDHPQNPAHAADLASTLTNLGDLKRRREANEAARVLFAEALSHRERLARDHPETLAFRVRVGDSHYNLGLVYDDLHAIEESERAHSRALPIRDELVRDAPEVHEYRVDLALTLEKLARIDLGLGRPAPAADRIDRALVEVRAARALRPDDPDGLRLHKTLLGLSVRASVANRQPGRALDALAALRMLLPRTPEDDYTAASYAAFVTPHVGDDAERTAVRAEAVRGFVAALDAGFSDLSHLQGDSDLDPIRDHPDVQAAIARLYDRLFPSNPFVR